MRKGCATIVTNDSPMKGKEVEEDSGDDKTSLEDEENEVSEPEPPARNQKSQLQKKKSALASSSGREPFEMKKHFVNSKKPSDRLWSADDEIIILKGMIDYRINSKIDPQFDFDDFFEHIKKSVQFDVSKAQFRNKIRTLKRKYKNCRKKVHLKEGHEQIVFDLLKKIWGTEADFVDRDNVANPPKANPISLKEKGRDSMDDAVVSQRPPAKRSRPNVAESQSQPLCTFMNGIENLGIHNWIEKDGLSMIIKGEKNREELKKLNDLIALKEVQIYANKLELEIEETKLILKTMKESDN